MQRKFGMTYKLATISALSTFFLVACASNPGDFCLVYEPFNMPSGVAADLVAQDRAAAVAAATNAEYYRLTCL
jgi:hypothetical protein